MQLDVQFFFLLFFFCSAKKELGYEIKEKSSISANREKELSKSKITISQRLNIQICTMTSLRRCHKVFHIVDKTEHKFFFPPSVNKKFLFFFLVLLKSCSSSTQKRMSFQPFQLNQSKANTTCTIFFLFVFFLLYRPFVQLVFLCHLFF